MLSSIDLPKHRRLTPRVETNEWVPIEWTVVILHRAVWYHRYFNKDRVVDQLRLGDLDPNLIFTSRTPNQEHESDAHR